MLIKTLHDDTTLAILRCLIDPTQIPDEVLLLVVGHVGKTKVQDLCLISRALNDLVTPLLYERVTFTWREEVHQRHGSNAVRCFERADPCKAHLLVRTLVSRPQLASFVRFLTLEGDVLNSLAFIDRYKPMLDIQEGRKIEECVYEWPLAYFSAHHFRGHEIHLLEEHVKELNRIFSLADACQSGFHPGLLSGKTILDLLFVVLSRLQGLKVAWGFSKICNLEKLLSLGAFKCLTGFEYEIGKDQMLLVGWQDYLHSLLSCDTVDSLTTTIPYTDLGVLRTVTGSSLKNLALRWSRVANEHLEPLLAATPQLQSFLYQVTFNEINGSRELRPDIPTMDCYRLNSALSHVSATLERLVIDVKFKPHTELFIFEEAGIYEGMTGHLHVLRGFSKLQFVSVPYMLLLGWSPDHVITGKLGDVLPSSLKELLLTDDMCRTTNFGDSNGWYDQLLYPVLEEFLLSTADADSRHRDLSVTLHIRDLDFDNADEWNAPMRARLESCSRGSSITCSVRKDPADMTYWEMSEGPEASPRARSRRGGRRGH